MSIHVSYCYVVNGATINCSAGTANSKLTLPCSHGFDITGEGLANTTDHKSLTNIGSFGNCKNQPKMPPCVPLTTAPWLDGQENFLVVGAAALTVTSLLVCAKGGVITVVTDGQKI